MNYLFAGAQRGTVNDSICSEGSVNSCFCVCRKCFPSSMAQSLTQRYRLWSLVWCASWSSSFLFPTCPRCVCVCARALAFALSCAVFLWFRSKLVHIRSSRHVTRKTNPVLVLNACEFPTAGDHDLNRLVCAGGMWRPDP